MVQEFRDAFPDHAAELDGWINELELVQTGCRELRPRDLGADASPEVADLAARLTCLMAAGALLGRWYATRSCPNSAFSRSDGALLAAFSRLSQLKESPAAPGRYAWTEHRVDAAVSQLRSTLQDRRSLGVEQLPITWAGPSPSDDKE